HARDPTVPRTRGRAVVSPVVSRRRERGEPMKAWSVWSLVVPIGAVAGACAMVAFAQEPGAVGETSYAKVDTTEGFESVMERMSAARPAIEREHQALLDRPRAHVLARRGPLAGRRFDPDRERAVQPL